MKKKINLRDLKIKNLRFKRIRFRIVLIIIGIFATLLTAFNFWFLDHSETALEQIVSRQSNGKLELKVENFKFNWITNKIELKNAMLRTKDTTAPVIYLFKTNKIHIKAIGFLPLLFNKILIDSIHINSPDVIITRLQPSSRNTKTKDTTGNFSVAEELGKITTSINNAINELKINSFTLESGSISLINKTKPDETPFFINNIDVNLSNLQVDTSIINKQRRKRKFVLTDEIAIRTHDQNIVFPGNKHFLSFKNFKVTLKDKRVEFDSCVFRSLIDDENHMNATIFFNKLKLTSIDFDAFYDSELIRTDSVFCFEPNVFLDIEAKKDRQSKNEGLPSVDELVRSLFGNVQINHIGVVNADIDINTTNKNGIVNNFSSQNNQIAIRGFTVNQDAVKPVNVQSISVSLYNYKTKLQNGKFGFAFDSLLFRDEKLNLYNFSFQEYAGYNKVKDFNMYKFELSQISWESLLYENKFKANNALFINPEIELTVKNNLQKKSKSIFETLNQVGESMELKRLNIQNGKIKLHLKKGSHLFLYNTFMDVSPDNLTSSQKIKNIKESVRNLYTSKVIYQKDATNVTLNNLKFINDNNGLQASSLYLTNKGIKGNLNDITIRSILLDNLKEEIALNYLYWQKGNLSVRKEYKNTQNTQKNKTAAIALYHILGKNTKFDFYNGKQNISGYFNTIALDQFRMEAPQNPEIYGLQLSGKNFLMKDANQKLTINNMQIIEKSKSMLNGISYRKVDNKDSIIAEIPTITIIPDISKIINGNIIVNDLIVNSPDIHAKIGKSKTPNVNNKKQPLIHFGSMLLTKPNIELQFMNKDDDPTYVSWNGVLQKSYLQLTNFTSTQEKPVQADKLKIYLTNFNFVNAKDKHISTDDNKLNLEFDNVLFKRNENNKIEWNATANILSLDKLNFDSLGKNNLVLFLDKGDVKNIHLDSRYPSIGEIIQNSKELSMTGTSGKIINQKNTINWNNLQFYNNYFSVDSFNMQPNQSLEEYKIAKTFNEDYLTVKTGAIKGGPFDMMRFTTDSSLNIGKIDVRDVDLYTFKDKTQKDTTAQEKPLFTQMIKNLNSKLKIDSLAVKNMFVEYQEENNNPNIMGNVKVENLNVNVFNINNLALEDNDSLYIIASGDILKKLHTQLQISQAYADTANTFLMNLQTKGADLSIFNSILIPAAGIAIRKGNLDGLYINAIANNNYATGNIQMYYKGLKVAMLNKKDLPNQNFINKAVSWLANALVIRTNNNGKPSPVFFERWKHKSQINYIIKISISGLKSAAGIPGTKRQQRKYFKRLLHREMQKQKTISLQDGLN